MGSYDPLKVLAIADDATGALEVGGQLAASGVRSVVTMEAHINFAAESVVVDAETRHLTAYQARGAVALLAAEARQTGVPFLYKKTDSTLRGNIASEFQALLDVFPERLLVYVPAYPRMGRVVVQGELYVDGKPLAETAFARDPLNPARVGSIPALLSEGCPAPVSIARSLAEMLALLRDSAPGSVVVCDGKSDGDLADTAAALADSGRSCIVAGTGGFVREWAARLPVTRKYTPRRRAVRRCIVVDGSLHPTSQEQIRRAAGAIPVVYLDRQPDPEAVKALAGQEWAALATAGGSSPGVAVRFGQIVKEVFARRLVDGLVIFGGDTALAVLAALGVASVESEGELLPGIPLSLAKHDGRELVLATKAGGFGTPETLLAIRERLEAGV